VSALHQPCVGYEVTDSWKAVDVVDFVEDHQGEDFSDAGDGAKQVNGYRIMLWNECVDLSFDREDLRVKGVHECGIHPDGGTDHRVGETVFDTGAIGAAVYALFERWQVVLEYWCFGCASGAVHDVGKATAGGEGDPELSA